MCPIALKEGLEMVDSFPYSTQALFFLDNEGIFIKSRRSLNLGIFLPINV
jgi:hypothetical protein